jgi:hypothetical protein
MQKDNLIVPVVGDFAGPKAIRSVAQFVHDHSSTVRAFYTSNVEQYLFEGDVNWKHFYENVAFLPIDSTRLFVRYVMSGWGFHERTSLSYGRESTVQAYRQGRIRAYYDVVSLSR